MLENPRHERFAQLIAQGLPAARAYVEAGYKENDSNAARLSGNERVQARLQELLAAAAIRTELTVAGITARLLSLADVSERTGILKNDEGVMVATSPKHLSVARAALMDAAKLNGLIVDKIAGAEGGAPILVTKIVLCGPDDDAAA